MLRRVRFGSGFPLSGTGLRYLSLAGLLALGCGREEAPYAPLELSFAQAFEEVGSVRLQEPDPPIGEIGSVVPRSGGGFFILDTMLQRILAYDEVGRLVGLHGRWGDGPGEYRSVGGLAVLADGRLIVSDPQRAALTFLSPELELTKVVPVGVSVAGMAPIGNRIVADAYRERGSERLQIFSNGGDPGNSFYRLPEAINVNPYWGSVAGVLIATGHERIVAGNTLLYPFVVFDHRGDSVGVLGTPPASFREVPMVERGAFLGASGTRRMDEWLASFTTVASMEVTEGRYMIVVHGRMQRSAQAYFMTSQYAIDVYDMALGNKLLADVRLEDGWKVIGGGRTLSVLISSPPGPWIVKRYALRRGGVGGEARVR